MTLFGLIQEWLRRRREPAPVQPVTHLDWFDLDPPPVGVNPTPLFITNADFHNEPDDVEPKPRWVDLFGIDPTYGKDVDPWLEQEAELALHVPCCGIWSNTGVCTENCRSIP